MNSERSLKLEYGALLWIGIAGLLARIPHYLATEPIWSGDSTGYSLAYFFWSHGYFYLAERTPVYPLLLGLAQWLARTPASPMLTPRAAYILVGMQSLLDIAAAVLLYYAARMLRVRRNIALAAALFAVTAPGLCSMEMNVLNLAPAFFVLTLGATLFIALMRRLETGRAYMAAALCTGIVLSIGGLLRSEALIWLAVLIAVLLLMSLRSWLPSGRGSDFAAIPAKKLAFAALLMAVSAAPPVLFWMTFNYVDMGIFRFTTLTGWNRSKTVYNMFDRVDPEDQVMGQILAASYHQRNHDGSIVRDHIWQAQWTLGDRFVDMPIEYPKLPMPSYYFALSRFFANVVGVSAPPMCTEPSEFCATLRQFQVPVYDYKLKDYLGLYVGKVSNKLIRKYPAMYLHNVADNFVRDSFNFNYTATVPAVDWYKNIGVTGTNLTRNQFLAGLNRKLIAAEAPMLTLLYVAMLCIALASPALLFGARSERAAPDGAVAALALATLGTILATCLFAGYNKEYSIAHLGAIILCAAYVVENSERIAAAIGRKRQSAAIAQPEPSHAKVQ